MTILPSGTMCQRKDRFGTGDPQSAQSQLHAACFVVHCWSFSLKRFAACSVLALSGVKWLDWPFPALPRPWTGSQHPCFALVTVFAWSWIWSRFWVGQRRLGWFCIWLGCF